MVGNGEKGGIGKKVERGKETRLGEKGHKEKGEEEEKRGSTHVYITIVQPNVIHDFRMTGTHTTNLHTLPSPCKESVHARQYMSGCDC